MGTDRETEKQEIPVLVESRTYLKSHNQRRQARPLPEDVDQHVQKGIEYHELGELEKATHHFRLSADKGSPAGMLLYGISLRHGWGCRANEVTAFQYLQKVAEHSVEELMHPEDAEKKSNHCAMASKAELVMAIYELGVSFQQGWGVRKNKAAAFYFFKMAAELGDADAQNETAYCYHHGLGVKKDLYQAAKLYRLAAAQGRGLMGNSWISKSKYSELPQN
ncbi:hypothetical protein EC973_003073 [Apophysomyces ossiformis]|uniref:HCP-like protein n=1 Tax=Apophysomyces ossiformis TaxID=679940 RepID=A0A8H7BG05_9FUNG|nr:hypothetical protein EC973_003073 [Apophysomyces ossiformis]